jgi:undecaprenyl-diphosphatase
MRTTLLGHLDLLGNYELPLCRYLNRVQSRPVIAFFRLVSRLGDGHLWVALALTLLCFGGDRAQGVLGHLLLLACVSLPLYKVLKHRLARERPYVLHQGIAMLVPPLDRYSFPSGHTLHAVAFTLLFSYYYPSLAWILVPFTVAVALSRVVLGVHYPSDVAAGFAIGLALSGLSFLVL